MKPLTKKKIANKKNKIVEGSREIEENQIFFSKPHEKENFS